MGLEAVMICMDNSEWSRNGDFAPSRWDSQQDAANIICQAKIQQNPENTLGIMAYSGRRADVRLTQTSDEGLLMNAINQIEIKGEADIFTAIKVAQLSLKHRQNKNQRQRIIIFVGHPLKEEESQFEELGIFLKRNNVSIDIINFAHAENVPKLQALVTAANSSGNSHFLDVPLGVAMITDVLIASPIINPDEGGAQANIGGAAAGVGASGAAVSQFQDYGGVDPNLDPELAMALRISMEEERARQHVPSEGASQQQEQQQQQPSQNQQPAQQQQVKGEEQQMEQDEDDEEYILQQAKLLSMQPIENKDDKAGVAKEDIKEIIDKNFVGDIVKDLNLDIGEAELEELLYGGNKQEKEDDEKKKKEDEKDKK